MKATAKFLVGFLTLGLMLSGLDVNPAAGQSTHVGLRVPLAVGQFGGDSDRRKEAGKWLEQAREAMKAGNLDLADDYLGRAEKLNVKYDSLFSRFVDTPAKVRKDLDELRAKSAKETPPSSRFSPTPSGGSTQPPPPSDPNTVRTAEAALNNLTDDTRAKAMAALRDGRLALEAGDVPAAIGAYQRAAATGAAFGPAEYSPESLAAELRQAGVDTSRFAPPTQRVAGLTPDDAAQLDRGQTLPSAPSDHTGLQTSPYRDSVIDNPLMLDSPRASRYIDDEADPADRLRMPNPADAVARQGDQLLLASRQSLAAGDLDRAAQYLQQAKAMGSTHPWPNDAPDKVEALLRRSHQLASGPAQPEQQATYARELAHLLMDQAEQLLPYSDLATAQRLVQNAKSLPVSYRQFERTPDNLLAKIAAQRARQQEPAAMGSPQGSPDGTQPARLPVPTSGLSGDKQQAMRLIAEARMALDKGDLATARRLAQQANALDIPNREFAGAETQPWEVLMEVDRRMNRSGQYPVAQAGANVPVDGPQGAFPVSQGIYRPEMDDTRNAQVQLQEPMAAQPLDGGSPYAESPGHNLYRQGLRALGNQDRETALRLFREAWQFRDELDPVTLQQLKDKLTLMRTPSPVAPPLAATPMPLPAEEIDSRQQVLRQKLHHEINNEVALARKKLSSSPREAKSQLERLRTRVNQAEVDPAVRKQLLTIVDRGLTEVEQFIEQNRGQIELDEANESVMTSVELSRQKKLEVQQKVAELVEKFNTLVDERRYEEAEIIAKQVQELDSNSELAQTLIWKSRFIRRVMEMDAIKAAKEEGFYTAMGNVDRSSIPFNDNKPFQFGDEKDWHDLTRSRRRLLQQQEHRLSPAEQEIQRSLKNKVDVRFEQRPLSEVVDTLSQLSGVPIHLDQAGLAAEGVTSHTPVTIQLWQPVSLQSALALILEPLKLSYVIQNEVLKVSSEQVRQSNVYTKVHKVADLVIPIPNFLPGYDQGMAGALREAYRTVGFGMGMGMQAAGSSVPLAMGPNQANSPPQNSSVLAQMGKSGRLPGMRSRGQQPNYGPGGLGGAEMADFDTLIELITTTIAPDSWDAVGGPGAIQEFPANLSLVISQTQEVHEQIADLLAQLRRLQDLQVTIEVRFITLNDNFFERIGVDFDFSIDDNVKFLPPDDAGPSVTIGLDETGQPTADFDLRFEQGSFGAAVPAFGGFDPGTAANFGFAILSDIEMFFVLQAAQGDERSNVLQAPKVTLFDGQNAMVSDTSMRPFVTSIIPVVGDFAAAQAPVILVLSEGTNLSVQAVVSSDRRFVRLTLVPFFSQIGKVETFTFDGKTTTRSGSNVVDPETGKPLGAVNNAEVTREGTTVQLPTFSFTSVSTTVSVPDGGTVLLGGIKRLREARTEQGLPFASQIPYISRLFKNVGIGRETNSLMMMVTPRIIIQEEEEERLGIDLP